MTASINLRIERRAEVSSTNSILLDFARNGEPEGLAVSADYQTEGRGKPGRKWISSRGKDLLFSLLLRPPVKAHELPIITQTACRSIASVLESRCGISPEFKRPNDLLVNGKKICGILTESACKASGACEAVVIGAGLNVNSAQDEIPETATSLYLETGKLWERDVLLKEILDRLLRDCAKGMYDSRS